jgi:hypothetical protein
MASAKFSVVNKYSHLKAELKFSYKTVEAKEPILFLGEY